MAGTKYLTLIDESQLATVAGQASWADLSIDARCDSCVFAERRPRSRKFYRCRKSEMLTGRQGVAFVAADARACKYYKKNQTKMATR
jgi:hypothetical protein